MAGFTIPNTPDASNQNQAEPDSLDFQILGNHKNAVVSGMDVTPGTGTSVNIAAGEILVNGIYYTYSGGTASLTTYGSLPFFDVIVARVSGSTVTCYAVPGAADSNPRFPAVGTSAGQVNPNTDVVIASVWRPDNSTPSSGYIVDKRLLVRSSATRLASGAATGGASGDLHVNSSWTPGNDIAGPVSVKVGSTWYQLAYNSTSYTAPKASTLAQGGGTGTGMTFNWSGQSGQPTWLWGSNDGVNHYVYNPSNFSVSLSQYTYRLRSLSSNATQLEGNVFGVATSDNIWPTTTNAYTLGFDLYIFDHNYFAWSAVYSYAWVNPSDRRQKKDIVDSDLGLNFINALRPVSYKWIVGENIVDENGAVTERPGVRTHYGFIAQEVKEAIDQTGVEDFAGWILSDKEDPESPQSLSTWEFIAPIVKALQELSAKVEALEAK